MRDSRLWWLSSRRSRSSCAEAASSASSLLLRRKLATEQKAPIPRVAEKKEARVSHAVSALLWSTRRTPAAKTGCLLLLAGTALLFSCSFSVLEKGLFSTTTTTNSTTTDGLGAAALLVGSAEKAAAAERGGKKDSGRRARDSADRTKAAPPPCLWSVATCASENEALLLLRERSVPGAAAEQLPQQRPQQAPSVADESAASEERVEGVPGCSVQQLSLEADVKTALQRGWWAAAKELILYSHLVDLDISSVVRQATQKIRGEIDEIVRLLDKRHHEVQVVPPAFQWAQSPVEIFLNIKFAYRWSSPGALSVSDHSFLSEPRGFFFSGIGLHSGIKKKYSLSLALFGEIEPQATKHSFASVGRVVVTLQKKQVGVWERLTEDSAKISNMNIWWDLKEKYQKDIEDFRRGNYTTPSSASADPSNSNNANSNNNGSDENSSTKDRSNNNNNNNNTAMSSGTSGNKKGSPKSNGSKSSKNGSDIAKPPAKANAQSSKGSATAAAAARDQEHKEEL